MDASPQLLTDLYQFTMAAGYWQLNLHEREAVFHLIFRKEPFKSHYAIACGLEKVIEFLQYWHFTAEDILYLKQLRAPDGSPLLPEGFLDYLAQLRFTGDIDAILEGTLVFPHEPLIRIKGPLLQCQLLESTLLNLVNFQTLIATKAARVCQAAEGEPVLEFGLRRAQGPDGALSASRAAYIGGCAATSNVLAGKCYDIPVSGTHAHSWVTAFSDELTAFAAYAEVMPHNCVLLVDTYDTVRGIKNAIEIGKQLKARGASLRGIRLDSGDMATLSIQARQLLDEAGFTETQIIASNSLDEAVITQLKQQGAKISVWGVGTSLVTAYNHPALDGVYKLSALCNESGEWVYKIKLSEDTIKNSNPGIHQVRRFIHSNYFTDVIYDETLGITHPPKVVNLKEPHQTIALEAYDTAADLLHPIFRKGQLVYTPESIHALRKRALQQVQHYGQFPCQMTLESHLYDLKQQLIKDNHAN